MTNETSALRNLHTASEGGLGKGKLGLVMAAAGVGKSACLVQIGLESLLSDEDIVHVAVGQTVEQINAWYDSLFADLAERRNLADKDELRGKLARRRVIKIFSAENLDATHLKEAIDLFRKCMNLNPKTILIDGYAWGDASAQAVPALKAMADEIGAALWMTATTPRGFISSAAAGITPPCDRIAAHVDLCLHLESRGSHVDVYVAKDGDKAVSGESIMQLHPETMRTMRAGVEFTPVPHMPASEYTLLSGGANGAEAEFGVCAEKWGLTENNFSFPGRGAIRAHGVIELTDEELQQGDVSSAYLKAHMHRAYPDTPLFHKVLQSIWHQVNTSGEVFHIGQLQADNTARGGTGWAVELAKHWGKPVYVYDQDRCLWYRWQEHEWVEVQKPTITRDRFTGTGTRFLNENGKKAIHDLFEDSFGPASR